MCNIKWKAFCHKGFGHGIHLVLFSRIIYIEVADEVTAVDNNFLSMRVVITAISKKPPSCRIIPVMAAPSPISCPRKVLRARVVTGIKSKPMAAPRKTSTRKKLPAPLQLIFIRRKKTLCLCVLVAIMD